MINSFFSFYSRPLSLVIEQFELTHRNHLFILVFLTQLASQVPAKLAALSKSASDGAAAFKQLGGTIQGDASDSIAKAMSDFVTVSSHSSILSSEWTFTSSYSPYIEKSNTYQYFSISPLLLTGPTSSTQSLGLSSFSHC